MKAINKIAESIVMLTLQLSLCRVFVEPHSSHLINLRVPMQYTNHRLPSRQHHDSEGNPISLHTQHERHDLALITRIYASLLHYLRQQML